MRKTCVKCRVEKEEIDKEVLMNTVCLSMKDIIDLGIIHPRYMSWLESLVISKLKVNE